MEILFGKIMINYLILPVIAILVAILAIIVTKKNKLLTRKMIVYFLLGCIFLIIPALLGHFLYWFMPYGYIALQLFYLIIGGYNLLLMKVYFRNQMDYSYAFECFFVLVMLIFSGAFFSLIFNLCNGLKYGLWASTCLIPFIFISVYNKACLVFLEIPVEVYKIWTYSLNDETVEFKEMDSSRLMLVDVEFARAPGDSIPLRMTVRVIDNMAFGRWFQRLLIDYNKRFPSNAILCYEETGWIFYTKPSFFKARKYIDPDLTCAQNKIKNRCTLVALRAQLQLQDTNI